MKINMSQDEKVGFRKPTLQKSGQEAGSPVMTTMEHTNQPIDMEKVKEYFKRDQFVGGMGVVIVDVTPGYARIKLDIGPKHLNGAGVVQGGALFTLADFAMAVAVNAHGRAALAISGNINFVKGVSSGTLYAEAREDSLGSKIASYNVKITDQTGTILATYQGLAYRKADLIPTLVV
jgi:acyl-CoA thioesterase